MCDLVDLEFRIKETNEFINQYRWIIDAYVSDFFVLGHWEKLPLKWRDLLQGLSPPELANILDPYSWDNKNVWPLSLLCFKACIQKLSLDRRKIDLKKVNLSDKLTQKTNIETCNESQPQGDKFFFGQYEQLYHIYRRHVKPKKQHEIYQLGQVIKGLSDTCDCCHVVDVGAGLGHLSRLLTFGIGLKVTTVEAAGGHAPKATTYDREMDREIKKKKCKTEVQVNSTEKDLCAITSDDITPPSHIIHTIEPSVSMKRFTDVINLKSNDPKASKGLSDTKNVVAENPKDISESREIIVQKFEERETTSISGEIIYPRETSSTDCSKSKSSGEVTIKEYISENPSKTESLDKCTENTQDEDFTTNDFILCGLHACGDLTATLLRLFVQCPKAVGLNSVGCCYMKLSTDSLGSNRGYPMSEFVSSLPNHSLSYSAREMACHFVDSYRQRLKENPPKLVVHAYRAALQHIILQKKPDFQKGALKITVKKAENMDFPKYAEIALKRIDLDSTFSETQLAVAESQTNQWKDVVSFYTIRLALAPVVETLILLDRVQYLKENDIQSVLMPVFDPDISPRNFVLLAKK